MNKSSMSIKYRELLRHISLSVDNEAIDFGLPEEVTVQRGYIIANALSELFGCQNFTFSRDYIFK